MPMVLEAVVAMLCCARIGAVHSVVFGGFSPDALKDRILDSDCRVVITADEGIRGNKKIPLKANVDKALESCPNVRKTIVVQRTSADINWNPEKDIWYSEAMESASDNCPPEKMEPGVWRIKSGSSAAIFSGGQFSDADSIASGDTKYLFLD